MHTQHGFRPGILGMSLLVTLCAGSVLAQTTDRSGIEGKVVDETGGVLPGVTVTISSPALQAPQLTAVSDAEGHYRFTTLPAGTYAIVYELQGFQTVKRDGVRLAVGFVATLDVKMMVGALEETVTVAGASPVVDVRTTTVSTNFTKEALEALPTARTMWQIIALSPGLRSTSSTPDVGGSQTGTQGGYANYGSGRGGNRPTLDGVETREVSTAAGFYYDFGAFEEVQIKAMANDAEMPLSGTAFVAVIKSGGNTFHGGALYQHETPRLQSNNIDDALRARGVSGGNPLKEYFDFNAELGGRIVRDRVWFYGGARRTRVTTGVVGYSRTAGPDGVYGTADDEPGEYRNDLTNYTVKITGQPTPKHRLQSFYQFNEKIYPERGGGAYTPAESTVRQVFTPYATKIEWTYIPTNRSVLNFLFGRHHWTSKWPPAYPNAGPSYYDTVTLRTWGTSLNNYGSTSRRGRWQYTGSFAYYKPDFLGGDHDLKAGFESTLEQYSREIPARGDNGDYQHRLQNGLPFEVIVLNSPLTGLNNMNGQSAYVKDSWKMGDRLTLNVGARWERYSSFLPAQSKPAGVFSAAADFPKKEIQVWSGVAPRTAVSYALTSDLKTVVKASYGLFHWPGLPDAGRDFNQNDLITTTYKWIDLNGNKRFEAGELGDFVSRTGASNRVLNPDLKSPKVAEITGTFERELMANFSARVSYIYKKEYRQYQSVNLARPYEVYTIPITTVDPGPDGRVGTADDGKSVTYYDFDPAYRGPAFERIMDVNTPGYTDRFHNIELVGDKRFSNRWQMLASFLVTRRNVWRNGIPMDPNAANFYPKDETWEWGFKTSGSYLAPYNIQLASAFTHQSGVAYARDVRFTTGLRQLSALILLMEPVGSQRRPHQNLLSLRVEKKQNLPFGEIALQFDLFNALNTNVATAITARSGTSYERITAIVPPRIARLGVTYKF